MIKGRQAVLDYFEQNNTGQSNNIYFSIYKRGQEKTGNPCVTTPEVEGWNYDQAYAFLQRWLDFQHYGDFTLLLNEKTKVSERGGLRQEFAISVADNTQSQIAGPTLSAADIDNQVTARVEGILAQKEKEKELAELKKKNLELEKENKLLTRKATDPWTVLVGELRPYIPHLLQEQGIIKTAVAGPQTVAKRAEDDETAVDIVEEYVHGQEPAPDVQTRLEEIVKKFCKARPDDWLEVLEFFAEKIEQKPSLVEVAKSFL